jgi:putative flavoprotein involved in K+ transport
VGAGACGLASAAELGRRGLNALVLERDEAVASSWARRYDTLRLNTMRPMSTLAGYRMPRRYGMYPSRDDVVEYLREYARRHELDIRFGTVVERVDRGDGGWRLSVAGGDAVEARIAVVATGYDVVPKMPSWPGEETFTGELIHAREYRGAGPFAGRGVLVVGAGNTGTEIAHHLLAGGAAEVKVSMRTPPNMFPRRWLGMDLNPSALLLERLGRAGDRMGQMSQRMIYGDLSRYGLPRAPVGPVTNIARGVAPAIDDGFVDDLKRGDVELVPVIERFDGDEVVLDGGRRLRPDVVIAATGYARGLEPIVGHLGVLREDGHPIVRDGGPVPGHPGLHFVGYFPAFSGQLRQARIQARRLGRSVKRARAAA